ncbi:IgGFc-binding protein-like [Thunnus thynnus]|uniref:IgGFc-binding protein-like n=1 Tax=Thunnus thynnus TaxID=8237 RepID=UPI003528ADA6
MGNLHYTFDSHYYTLMGNCTYIMASNCHVDGTHPAFAVETKNMNVGNVQVPTVGAVTVHVYGFNINIVRLELGVVRVNYQQWNLPINLNDGKVRLFQRGLYVVMETDFGLTVQYDWQEYLAITVPGSFAGSMCGLCGNFNNKKEDDLITPSGSVASSVTALGESWRVQGATNDIDCQDQCGSQCESCPLNEFEKLEKQIFCSFLLQDIAGIIGCLPEIDSSVFESNCMLNLCRGETVSTYFCKAIQGYADICQKSGVKVPNWRISSKCPSPKCPENSHYEFCGSGCPATCANPNTPLNCNATCVETCVCNDGFLLSGTKCVPKAQCGCLYEGHFVEAGASFWGDENCTERYTCSAGGHLSLKQSSCPVVQQCKVVEGLRSCYPVDYATCMVFGDPHLVTFDGQHYNFQGTCAYQMVGISSNQTSLDSFSVVLQSDGRDKKTGSVVKLVEVKVYGYTLVISKEQPGSVLVNGELSNLPVTLDSNKLQLYTSGWFAVIETDFGVKVYYDWSSIAFVIVPSTVMGATQGLCGNYNLNPKDDMQMRDGKQAATSEELGQSWKVSKIPGCVDGCSGPCPVCNATQKAQYNTSSYCGLIRDPAGPFRDCHSKVDPTDFLNDCLYDVCLYQGSKNMQCKTLTAYTAACQLKGATVHSWRSAQFCDAQCPSNSHYELCTNECLRSCQNDSALCGAQCMEGCACNEGFLLSGDECVPANQCGCMYEGKYYQHGQVFYPDDLCQEECICNGTVECKNFSCGLYEKCEMKNGVRSCQPLGKGICSIYGDPHYNTFDNTTYDFQGTCTYIAAEGCHLSGTRLTSFSVMAENEKWYRLSDNPEVAVAKLVAVEVYGTILILRRNEAKMVWINGVLHHLPQKLLNGAITVYQEGANDVIVTDFGLRVTYDLVYHITISVPGNYRGKTCGLCGNYNGNKQDEFQLPDGNVTKDLQAFGAAWKVPVRDVVCEDGCSGDLCPKCDNSEKAVFEAKCAIITNPKGPFAGCHDIIDPAPYFRDCVYDVCMAKDDQATLCHSIAAYMLDCQDFGTKIESWRSPSFCPFNCTANSHYETCVLPCTSPCSGLPDTISCNTTCVEGCACDKGYYNNGTGCVPFDQCGCYYKGITYEVGASIITDDCHSIHTCQASGVVLSTNMTCDPNEICQVKNGVMGCYRQQCFLQANGTLTAFSGEVCTITVPGSYEIIQSCDQSRSADWFRVVVKLETCTPGVNTIVAVHVFFNGVMITLNTKHDVWIDGRTMTQTTVSQNNVTVEVSNNTVSIYSASSLQLSFSLTNELTISVSDKVADMVCGACGKLRPIDTTPQDLRERLLGSFHELRNACPSLDLVQWTAPDFPKCGL